MKMKKNGATFQPVGEIEIFKTVRNLKNACSCGHDNISVNILKKCIHLIERPLLELINISLLKRGDKTIAVNDRPITFPSPSQKYLKSVLQTSSLIFF